jgi:tetratricopeptide (TPR) repeat protein
LNIESHVHAQARYAEKIAPNGILLRVALASSPSGEMNIPPPEVRDPVDNFYLKGNYAQSTGNYDFAIVCWNSVLKINPKDATAWFNLGVAYESKRDGDEALESFSEAIRLDPKDPSRYEARARVYAGKPGSGIDGEKLQKALADYDSALHLRLEGIDDPETWLKNKAARAENDIQALACWNAAIKRAPKNAKLRISRAGTYQHMGDRQKALADYTEAIQLDPEDPDAYFSRATFYLGNEGHVPASDIAKGVDDLTAMIQLKPSKNAYIYRGYSYTRIGEDEKALADYTEMIRLKANYGGLYYAWAMASYQKKDWSNAIPDLDMAVDLYTKANDGSVANALELRGSAYYHNKEWEKALTDFNRVIAGSANDWQGRRGAAWIYATCPDEKFRDGAKAVKIALELCALGHWRSGTEIDTLAAAEAELGKWENAVNYEKMALATGNAQLVSNLNNPRNSPALSARIKADFEQQIQGFTGGLTLYGQKTPSRDEKELIEYLFF